MHSGAMSSDRIARGSRGRDAPPAMMHRAERVERVQRAVRGAADVRLAARHLELAARPAVSHISPLLSRSSTPAIRSNALG